MSERQQCLGQFNAGINAISIMKFLVIAIYSCALLWAQSVCDSGTEKMKRAATEGSRPGKGYEQAPPSQVSVGKPAANPSSGSVQDDSKRALHSQGSQDTSQSSTLAGSNIPSNQQFSNNPQPLAFDFTRMLTHSPQFSFSAGFSAPPYNFNFLSSPLLNQNNELLAEAQNSFIVNQPLPQPFSTQTDLTGLSQAAGLYSASQSLLNSGLNTGISKYLQPGLTLATQAANSAPQIKLPSRLQVQLPNSQEQVPAPPVQLPTSQFPLSDQQFKTTPLINSHIYHHLPTTAVNAPRQNTFANGHNFAFRPTPNRNLLQNPQNLQQNQANLLQAQPNLLPAQPNLLHKQPIVLQNPQNLLQNQRNLFLNQPNLLQKPQNLLQNQPKEQITQPKVQNIYPYRGRLIYKLPNLSNQQNTAEENPAAPVQQKGPASDDQVPNRQQSGVPRRYYIRRRPQHVALNQGSLVLVPESTPFSKSNPQNNGVRRPQYNQENAQPVRQRNRQNLNAPERILQHPSQVGAPPTPPRFYTNFKPIQSKEVPVKERTQGKQRKEEANAEDEKEDIEDEAENKRRTKSEEEDDNSNYRRDDDEEEVDSAEEEDEAPARPRFRGKYRHDDDDEEESKSYKRDDADDEDDDEVEEESKDYSRYSESRPDYSKLFSKHRYPEEYNFVPPYLQQHVSPNAGYDNKNAFNFNDHDPDVQVKMFKYTKSVNPPDVNESIEGKESESVPVVHHKKKSYKEQWLITKSSKSIK